MLDSAVAGVAYLLHGTSLQSGACVSRPWVLEDPWHADQIVERADDGSVLLTVKASHELEVIPRVLALGAEAELLSPPASRERLREIASTLQAAYEKPV